MRPDAGRGPAVQWRTAPRRRTHCERICASYEVSPFTENFPYYALTDSPTQKAPAVPDNACHPAPSWWIVKAFGSDELALYGGKCYSIFLSREELCLSTISPQSLRRSILRRSS